MAKFSRGITFSANDYLTAAKLHALIDTAIAQADAFPGTPTLYDIVMGDLNTVRAIHTASSPSSPATNDLMVGSDGLLDRWTGAAWVDLTTDYITLTNSGAFTFVTGTPVVIDTSNAAQCKLWSTAGVCPDPFGVAVEVIAPSGTGKIQYRGLAPVKSTASVDQHVRIAAQGATMLSSTSAVDNSVLGIIVQVDTANPLSGNALAMLVH